MKATIQPINFSVFSALKLHSRTIEMNVNIFFYIFSHVEKLASNVVNFHTRVRLMIELQKALQKKTVAVHIY